jgi:AmmeMemoRadiSam system protein A
VDFETLGIIAPHPPIMVAEVGGGRAGETARSAEAMQTARALLERFDPDVVVVSSPHAPLARDAFLIDDSARLAGDLGGFSAPSVRLEPAGDPELADSLQQIAARAGLPVVPRGDVPGADAGLLDHGVVVPMSFLDRESRYPLLAVSLSLLSEESHTLMGRVIADAADALGRRVAYVASGDLSHRLSREAPAGYSPRGKDFDATVVDLVSRGDFAGLTCIAPDLVDAAGQCGLRSFLILGGFLDGRVPTRVLAYEGPWGVGYLTAVSAPEDVLASLGDTPIAGAKGGVPGADESEPVRLARQAIEAYVRTGRILGAEPDEGLLGSRAGAFVSLHTGRDLRGCIGTIEPTYDHLAEEIVANAIKAATQDPRFPPVDADELDALDIKVDVLHEPEPVDDIAQLDPGRYGVIVTKDWRRGLLLPDLEGVDTVEQQLSIARRKAGIGADETVSIARFRVDRYS